MDGRVYFWRTDTWARAAELLEPVSAYWPPNVAFHPKTAVLASLGKMDEEIRVWDVDIDAVLGTPRDRASDHSYCSAKVVLVGESGRGKTALARVLLGGPYEEVVGSTHGMRVGTYAEETVELADSETVIRETLLWDLAGQADYQIIHHLFLDEAALGIVLFDPSDRENPFKGVSRWDKALRRVAGEECPRLLVAGRVDVGPPIASIHEVNEVVTKFGFKSFLQTSAKTGRGMAELHTAIRESIPWDRLPKVTSPKLWNDIRNYLLDRRASRDVLTTVAGLKDGFSRNHPLAQFQDAAFDSVLQNAQAQGVVWRLSFGGFVLLQPDLLSCYAASVVHAARKDPDELGCVRELDVKEARIDLTGFDRIPDPEAEKALLHAVVELFLKREVALREGSMLVFPSKFTRTRPDTDASVAREVAFRFEGPVEDIYATLIVRLSYSGLFRRKETWKDMAEFLNLGGSVCRISIEGPDEGIGLISVSFEPVAARDTRLMFLKFIQDHLELRALPGSVRRERLYYCPKCGREVKDREAIAHRLSLGRTTVLCPYDDEPIALDDPLERLFEDPGLVGRVNEDNRHVSAARDQEVRITVSENKKTFGEFDVFLAHNSLDKDSVDRVAQELWRRGLSPWLDKEQIAPGRWFQDVIQQDMRNVKTAAIFLGQSGLGRWQKLELRSFLADCVEHNVPVIPVLLPGVESIPDAPPFLFLKQLNRVEFKHSVLEEDALDDLEWGITGKHPKRSRERPDRG